MDRPRRRHFQPGDRVQVVVQGTSVPYGSRGTVAEVYQVSAQCAVYFDGHEVLRVLPFAALEPVAPGDQAAGG